MQKNEKNIRLLRAVYLSLCNSGLGSCQAAESVYKNFNHEKTTGWIRNDFNQPVVAFCGEFLFNFQDETIYKKVEIK